VGEKIYRIYKKKIYRRYSGGGKSGREEKK